MAVCASSAACVGMQVARTGTMGMTHLLARMKSLLREQHAWEGSGEGKDQLPSSDPVLTAVPEEAEEAAEDPALHDDHISNNENQPQVLQSAAAATRVDGKSVALAPPNVESRQAASHEKELQQYLAPHDSQEQDGQDPTSLTDNPTYTTSPSTPATGYPKLTLPGHSRLAPQEDNARNHPVINQARLGHEADAARSYRQSATTTASQDAQQAGLHGSIASARDASSFSREELIERIQELEQQAAAGQLALAEIEERLAISQQRMQVNAVCFATRSRTIAAAATLPALAIRSI